MSKKNKKQVTLAEFKAWLEGVEELQAKNWCPSPEQWKLIRNKIRLIEDGPSSVDNRTPQQSSLSAEIRNTNPAYRMTAPSSPGFVPDGEIVESSSLPSPQSSVIPPTNPLLHPDSSGKLKTPDIDTSDGSYTSSLI